MKNAKLVTLGLVLLMLAAVGWRFLRRPDVRSDVMHNLPLPGIPTIAAPSSPAQPAMRAPHAEELQKISPHPNAVSFGQGKPEDEPAKLLELFEVYRRDFGAFPSGEDNLQMMYALCGSNPRNLPIFPLDHPRLASQAGLVDAWNKPFVFHLISSDYLEIRSLGRDGELFTADDILVPSPRNR